MNPLEFLAQLYPAERLAELIPAYGTWRPIPILVNRVEWEAIPKQWRDDYLALGQKALETD